MMQSLQTMNPFWFLFPCLLSCFTMFSLYVHANENLILPLYATKTGYDLSLETTSLINNSELNWFELARSSGASVPEGLDNCTPDGVYVVYRHGTRFPSDGDLEDVHNIIDRLRNTDINPEFHFLRDAAKIPISNASELAETGWREMRQLAARVVNRFPELFPDAKANLSRYSFQSTGKTRTIDSARAFIEGIVGDTQTCHTVYSQRSFTVECLKNASNATATYTVVPHNPIDNDPLLRFYDVWETCTEAVNNGRTDREQDTFRDGAEIGEVWQRVAQKLAVPGTPKWQISRDEVILLTEICGYDRALYDDTNTWCELFETRDLYAPEYHSELKNYWNAAYGFPTNHKISCTLAQDILTYLQQRANGKMRTQTPLANFKFAHLDTIVPLIALLDLYMDPLPLLASNFQKNINRTFRTAHIAPFAGNVAFALYRCNGGNSESTYRVQMLHNESPVQLGFCAGQFCTLQEFKAGIERAIGTCDITEKCLEIIEGTTQNPTGSAAEIHFSLCLQFAFVAFSFVFLN